MSVCKNEVFEKVFSEQAEDLRNFLYYKCGNLSKAEDFTQDAFVKLWKNCAKVSVEKVKSFLFAIGNNLFLNEVKHQKVVLKFEQRQKKTSSNQSPAFLLEEKEFHGQLEQAISNLTEGQRVVFLMNRIDKKKYREIAEELGISVKAVEKRMHGALSSLRKLTPKI